MSTNGNATIAFKVADNGIGSFMDNIKRKSDQMTNDIIRSAQAQTNNTKEQTKIIQDQIKLLERKVAIEKAAVLEQAKQSRENRLSRVDQFQYDKVTEVQAQMRNKTITGKAGREQIEQIQGRAADMRDKIESNYSEKVTAVNASGREAALTNQLLRQNIDTAKGNSREQLNQMRKGDESIVNAVGDEALPLERFENQTASQQFEEESKEKKKKEETGKKKEGSMLGSSDFMKTIAIDRSLELISRIPNTKNELDFIKPMTTTISTAIGGAIGAVMLNGALGALVGQKAGEFFGGAIERSWQNRDEVSTANFRLQALTGQNLNIEKPGPGDARNNRGLTKEQIAGYDLKNNNPQGFEKYGIDFAQESEIEAQAAQRQGRNKNLRSNAENVLAAEQGLGVQKETSFALMELQRTSAVNDRDFLRTLGGILQEGQKQLFAGDRTFLNEFVTRNYATLQRELLKTNTRVASGTTMDILQKADSIGGQWSARDPRSLGLIGQVNGALANPGSDNMKALSFSVMQKLHPGAGFFELQQRIQHGLAEPGYGEGMKNALDNISGGDSDFAEINFANAFGLRGNLDAADELYKNPAILKRLSNENLAGTGKYGEKAIREAGQEQTSYYTQSTAQIQNRYVEDVEKAVKFVGEKMKDLFGDMTDQLKKFIKDQISDNQPYNEKQAHKNGVATGRPDDIRTRSGANLNTAAGRQRAMSNGDMGPHN